MTPNHDLTFTEKTNIAKALGTIYRRRRLALGLTRAQVSRRIGMAESTYSGIEEVSFPRQGYLPTLLSIIRIARGLDASVRISLVPNGSPSDQDGATAEEGHVTLRVTEVPQVGA